MSRTNRTENGKTGKGRPSADLVAGSTVNEKPVTHTEIEAAAGATPIPPLNEGGIVDDGKGKEITVERWQEAQVAERAQHTMGYMEGVLHYAAAYKNYFRFVGLGNDLGGLHVIEVGPADFPALQHCKGDGKFIIIEPMPSEHLDKICKEQKLELLATPVERLPDSWLDSVKKELGGGLVEVWLFNVMQHVYKPDEFIRKVKLVADRIRFFEPVDQPITDYHPHTYTLDDYKQYFGDVVQLYAGGSVPGFHEADCAYGVWIKE